MNVSVKYRCKTCRGKNKTKQKISWAAAMAQLANPLTLSAGIGMDTDSCSGSSTSNPTHCL